MAGFMWMGPRGHGMWVPAPAVSPTYAKVGWLGKTQQLNGGATVRSSFSSHMEYMLTWNLTNRDSLRPISDMQAGMFGAGLIHWTDPVAADKNVLPEHFAFPAQAALDAPVLVGTKRPSTVNTPANTLGYPVLSTAYEVGAAKSVYIPIPEGFVAWVGWHGSGVGGLKVTPAITGAYPAAAEFPAALTVSDPTRVNASYSSSQYVGIDVELVGGVVHSGIMVQIFRAGVTPPKGAFISGQGHYGCKFEGAPVTTPYSAPLDLVGMTAKLTEVWE